MVFTYFLKIKHRILKIISQELSEHKVALAISLGLVFGIVPFFMGLSIYLSLLASWRLKLNHILIQIISNAIYPLQLILFIPFLKFGTTIFSSNKLNYSLETVFFIIKHNPIEALKIFGIYHVYGLILWSGISLILAPIFYFTTKNIIKKLKLMTDNTEITIEG